MKKMHLAEFKYCSSRVVTDASGNVLDDADFYPFGGERSYLSTSGNNYKFTGKECDIESGLDDFGARYFTSQYGRFMTPDWSASPVLVPYADLGNPRTFNLYSYVANNPVNTVDPEGHFCLDVGSNASKYNDPDTGEPMYGTSLARTGQGPKLRAAQNNTARAETGAKSGRGRIRLPGIRSGAKSSTGGGSGRRKKQSQELANSN